MIPTETTGIVKRASELFPGQLNDEQAALLSRTIASRPYKVCTQALEDHRLKDQWFSLPLYIRHIDAAQLRIQRAVAKSNADPVWLWIKSLGRYGGPEPIDFIRQHYRACAGVVRNSNTDGHGQSWALQMVFGHCRAALMEINVAEADARELAAEVVGPFQRVEVLRAIQPADVEAARAQVMRELEAVQ